MIPSRGWFVDSMAVQSLNPPPSGVRRVTEDGAGYVFVPARTHYRLLMGSEVIRSMQYQQQQQNTCF